MKAMVLAAGVGSRLDPLTTQVPKPLVPIVNRPVLEHTYCLLKRHGITNIASNLHHLPDKLIGYFGDGSQLGLNLHFHQEPELTGDAGGVRALRHFLDDGTFIVMMGDLFTDANLSEMIAEHKRKGALATIGLKQVDDVTQFGVVMTDSQGFITGFQEKPQADEALSNLASTGIYILEPEVFRHIPATGSFGFGRQLFPGLVGGGLPVLGYEIKTYWSDVGTIKQYRQSNFDALEGKIQVDLSGQRFEHGFLGQNSTIEDGASINGLLLMGKNSRLGKGVKITGRVVVGDNCVISRQAQLEDSVVWSDTTIESGAVLKDAVIGLNCVVNGAVHLKEATVVPT